jgi:hypothetical protein
VPLTGVRLTSGASFSSASLRSSGTSGLAATAWALVIQHPTERCSAERYWHCVSRLTVFVDGQPSGSVEYEYVCKSHLQHRHQQHMHVLEGQGCIRMYQRRHIKGPSQCGDTVACLKLADLWDLADYLACHNVTPAALGCAAQQQARLSNVGSQDAACRWKPFRRFGRALTGECDLVLDPVHGTARRCICRCTDCDIEAKHFRSLQNSLGVWHHHMIRA